mmetsp:Transcript_69120/g.156742  ORF Transcript_69120/g.156742 Transcript_69120/m.156742 type:complete len:208 (-) Transcript_69120:201-824(-)
MKQTRRDARSQGLKATNPPWRFRAETLRHRLVQSTSEQMTPLHGRSPTPTSRILDVKSCGEPKRTLCAQIPSETAMIQGEPYQGARMRRQPAQSSAARCLSQHGRNLVLTQWKLSVRMTAATWTSQDAQKPTRPAMSQLCSHRAMPRQTLREQSTGAQTTSPRERSPISPWRTQGAQRTSGTRRHLIERSPGRTPLTPPSQSCGVRE